MALDNQKVSDLPQPTSVNLEAFATTPVNENIRNDARREDNTNRNPANAKTSTKNQNENVNNENNENEEDNYDCDCYFDCGRGSFPASFFNRFSDFGMFTQNPTDFGNGMSDPRHSMGFDSQMNDHRQFMGFDREMNDPRYFMGFGSGIGDPHQFMGFGQRMSNSRHFMGFDNGMNNSNQHHRHHCRRDNHHRGFGMNSFCRNHNNTRNCMSPFELESGHSHPLRNMARWQRGMGSGRGRGMGRGRGRGRGMNMECCF